MAFSMGPHYAKPVTFSEYICSHNQKIPAGELSDEFYILRHQVSKASRSDRLFALDMLVSIENVTEKDEYYVIDYEFTDTKAIETANQEEVNRSLLARPDGLIFFTRIVRSLTRKEVVKDELGYMLAADDMWEGMLPEESIEKPRDIVLV